MKVFISHSSQDKNFVRKLKKDLNDNLIDTWLDEDEMFLGDDLIEKLNVGLDDSSHFLIILSPSSVESEWVKLELENALNQIQVSTIEKIIPIKYRECNVPVSLKNLLYLDLSQETVFTQNNQLEFYGNNYSKQLDMLIRALKKSQTKLTNNEKDELTGKKPIKNISNLENSEYLLKVVGFASISRFLATYVSDTEKANYSVKPLSEFKPITLPRVLEPYFEKLKFGDEIELKAADGKVEKLDFAKFTSNNSRIAIPKEARTNLNLSINNTYKMDFDFNKKSISTVTIKDE
jgi:hypothetical protein